MTDESETPRTLQQAEDELEAAQSLQQMLASRMELAQMVLCPKCLLRVDLCTDDHPIIHIETCEYHKDAPYLLDYIRQYQEWAEKYEGTVQQFMEQLDDAGIEALLKADPTDTTTTEENTE